MVEERERAFLYWGNAFPSQGKRLRGWLPHLGVRTGQMVVVTPVSAAAHRLASLFEHQAGEMGSA